MTRASRRLGVIFVNLAKGSTLIDADSIPWRSMGLAGERHQIRLRLGGHDAEHEAGRMAQALPDHEFTLPGLLVADVAITATQRVDDGVILTLEALIFAED